MIRSVKNHFQQYTNVGKSNALNDFLNEYHKALSCCIDWIWNNPINDENEKLCWNISNDMLNLPKYLDYNDVDFKDSKLSCRAKSAVITQASGIIRGSTGIKRNLINKIEWMKEKGLQTDKWQKRLEKIKISKPNINCNVSAELSSKNIDFQKPNGFFEYWIRLSSIGLPEIKIPIKLNKRDVKWIKKKGVMLGGICINRNYIQLRYDVPIKEKEKGKTVGCDTGIKTVATFSHKKLYKADKHGHTLESINHKLERKKKGSKAFLKAQQHRTNYINWFINSISMRGIKKVNLEDVSGIFHGRKVSRWMKHWVHAEIATKILSKCEELGVQVQLHDLLAITVRDAANADWYESQIGKVRNTSVKTVRTVKTQI